ncbi:sulfotransferase 1B1-like [Achroia grisella]|uniref:sulfotransferase 1B1-like n=1 Tax=Achroia grisella TaxID=688607 RepID=UPI0027D21821|nr:sulfotransferase 1B1-like [Achroia grisella]
MAPWLELPYEINNVTDEEDKLIKKILIGYSSKFVKCGKHGYVMPGSFKKHAEAIYNMEVRPDDVWVITFPRSGTTWTQELIWLLKNNLDYATAKSIPLYERFPMLELTSKIPDIAFELIKTNFMNLGNFQGLGAAARCPSWKRIENAPSPRFIKTHLPLSLLPPKLLSTAKVVYVGRDPRDVAVSYYYLHKMVAKTLLRSGFPTFWEVFRRDLLPWTPIISHTNEAWMKRHEPNLHFIFYEDMIKDLPTQIRRMCKFLGKEYTEEQIKQLSVHLSFDSLRKNKSVNNTTGDAVNGVQFVRKGEAGGWKTHFDQKMEIQAEEFIIARLRGLDLIYPSFLTEETTHL